MGLSALLSACGSSGGSSISAPVTPAPTYTLSGQVLTGAAQVQALTLRPQTLTASPQQQSRPIQWSAPHVAGHVLVMASPAAARVQVQALSQSALGQSAGGKAAQVQALGSGLTLISTPTGQSDQAFAAALAQQGLQVQPDYLYHKLSLPSDPGYPSNAGITVGGAAYTQSYLSRIHAQQGWDALSAAGKPLTGTVVGVLDTGVDTTHPDLQGRLLPGYDFCSGADTQGDCLGVDSDVSEAQGQDGHGTGVAGILGASTDNGLGLTGLTWQGKNLLPIKVFNAYGASTSAIAQGLEYAVNQGAKVINMSLGIEGQVSDPALTAAISSAASHDVLLVASAGNTPTDGIYYPASDLNVLAVGAVGNDDNALACYSARPIAGQKALDMLAPGGNASGNTSSYTACITYNYGADDLLVLAPGGYTLSDGTSDSAPQVAGAASLIRGARPDLSALQVQNILKSSAHKTAAGNVLDVGAAVNAALNAPQGSAGTSASYSLNVTAYKGSVVVGQSVTSGDVLALPAALPYTITPKLSAGTYTLKATLQYRGSYSGSAAVSLNADTTQDITVR